MDTGDDQEPFNDCKIRVMYCMYDLLTVQAEISYVVNLFKDQQYFYRSIRTRHADVYSCCMHVRVCSTVCFYLLM